MSRLIWFLVKLGVLVALGIYFAANPGSVRIEWLDLRIDTSFALLIAALALLVGIAFYWERFAGLLRRAPGRFREKRKSSNRERGYRALTQGFVSVAAGDADEAIKQSRLAEQLLKDPPLTRLLAAQAAQLSGDDQAARNYFTSMLDDPNGAFLGLRGLMVQATRAGDRAAALKWAEKMHALRPETPWVVRELIDLQTETEQWDKALATLDSARKRKSMPRDEVDRRRSDILVVQARQLRREGLHRTAMKLAEKARKLNPDSEQAVALSAELHWHESKTKKGEKLIEDAWSKAPSTTLSETYRAMAGTDTDTIRLYERAKHLAARNPEHEESRVLVAIAALDASLWGEARQQLGAIPNGQYNPRVCRLMARLEEAEYGNLDAARTWLARAAGDMPDDNDGDGEEDSTTIDGVPAGPDGTVSDVERTSEESKQKTAAA